MFSLFNSSKKQLDTKPLSELYSEKSANRFYARHGKTGEGREYIEFSKFGPIPNSEDGTSYIQKLRLFSALQWAQLKHYVEHDLAQSIGWDLKVAYKEFARAQRQSHIVVAEPTTAAN